MLEEVSDNLAQHDRDGVAPSLELTPLRYREIAEDIRRAPSWRQSSDKASAYYHGLQITPEEAEALEQRGMGELITNLIKPAINSLLGLEAKTRTDWRVVSDREEDQELSEAMSAKLMEAERETRADSACSDAFASQIIAGLGWTFVGRNSNPFEYPYLVETVHRREMHWDWHARRPDLSDARYVVRERWYPSEQIVAFFPEQADMIRAVGSGWSPEWLDLARDSVRLMHAFDQERRSEWFDSEWRNIESKMVSVREVWHRHYVRGLVLALPDGRTVELDMKNPVHVAAVAQGVARPRPAVYSKLRVSLWIGPHRLADEDYGMQALPYTPFWGYREDNGIPYGVVRDMIPLQDEANARRRKLLWLLSSKRVMADSDALDTQYNDFGDLTREVSRPDAVIITNPNRRNANAISVENDLNLSTQQYQVMIESQEAIQRVAGIYNSMMGRTDGAKSGTAISSLVEQGQTSQGDINDNYRYSRTLTGQRLLELITQDMSGTEVTVMAGDEGRRKAIFLNKPVMDAVTGIEYRENDVSKALVKVALNDVPSTPAYRAQAMTMIAEVIKGLPPQLQAPLVPYFLESTELPKRREMAELVRKVLGLEDGAQADPEKQQLMQTLEQMQLAMQQGVEQYEGQIAELQQKLGEQALRLQARDEENRIRAADLAIKAEAQAVQNLKTAAETRKVEADIMGSRTDTATKVLAARQPPAPQQPGALQ